MKKALIALPVLLLVLLAACVPVDGSAPSTDTADINRTRLDLQATQAVLDEIARSQTQTAYQATQVVEHQRATQTQTALDATATVAANATQAMKTLEIRQTEQAWTITESAAWANATATQQYVDRQATLDAAAIQAQQTTVAAQAQTADNAADRDEMINSVRAWLPYAAGCILFVVLLAVGIGLARAGINRLHWIKRDERGDAPIRDNGRTVYDPDRNPGAALVDQDTLLALFTAWLKIRFNIEVEPAQAALVDQSTTERDQMVDLATRGLPDSGAASRRALPPGIQRAIQAPRFTVYSVDQSPPLDSDTQEALGADWDDSQSWEA